MSAVQNSKRAVQFSDLGVASVLVDVLKRAGIKEPFPIQAATIPDAVAGRDVLDRERPSHSAWRC